MLIRIWASLALVFFIPSIGKTQEVVEGLSHENAWVFAPLSPDQVQSSFYRFRSGKEATKLIEEIMAATSLPANFQVFRGPIENAAAQFVNGQRVIYYSEDWFARVVGDDRWKAITVLAHEIGHHLSGHTFNSKADRRKQELEADIFAGSIVARLGGSLEDAQRIYKTLPKHRTETHPDLRQRLEAVAIGWKDTPKMPGSRKSVGADVDVTPKIEDKTFVENKRRNAVSYQMALSSAFKDGDEAIQNTIITRGLRSQNPSDRSAAIAAWLMKNRELTIAFTLPNGVSQQTNGRSSYDGRVAGLLHFYNDNGGILTFRHDLKDLKKRSATIWNFRNSYLDFSGPLKVTRSGIRFTSSMEVSHASKCSFDLKLIGQAFEGMGRCKARSSYAGFIPFPVRINLY